MGCAAIEAGEGKKNRSLSFSTPVETNQPRSKKKKKQKKKKKKKKKTTQYFQTERKKNTLTATHKQPDKIHSTRFAFRNEEKERPGVAIM